MALEDELRERIEQRVRIIREQDSYTKQVGHATQLGFLVEHHADRILAALTERKAPVEVEGLVERLRDAARRRGEAGNFSPVAFIEWEAATALLSQATELATLKQQLAEREEALTPSGDTKAAYMGEFAFDVMVPDIDEDNDELVPMQVYVPWTTIKEIMAAIRARALTDKGPEQKDGDQQ